MKSQTSGTWIAIVVNCLIAVVGVLQATDFVHLVGSEKAGGIAAVLSIANICLHYFTGPVAGGTPSVPPQQASAQLKSQAGQ